MVVEPKTAAMKSKKQIFGDLLLSAKTSCVLKIKLQNVTNPIITAVDTVEKGKIILKPTCLYGYALRERSIRLHDIEGVTRYKTNFDNPLFVKLRFIKDNISAMRRNLEGFGQEAMLKRA